MRESSSGPALCKSFSHVEPAEAFIQGRLNKGVKQGFLVFWTLPGQPLSKDGAADGHSEVLVLVAERGKAEMVRQFTFSDLSTAREFAQSRHADRDVTIAWSLPMAVHRDDRGAITLSPSTAPATSASGLSASAADDVHEAMSLAEAVDEARCEEPAPSPITSEVRKVLALKRWEYLPGAFDGFHSPPGRF